MREDLIILGNGFDLACGLKSGYNDFYRDRIDEDAKKVLDMYRLGLITIIDKKQFNFLNAKCDLVQNMFSINRFHELAEPYLENWNNDIFTRGNQKIKELTFWDIVFYYSKLSETDWNCIEKRIESFLTLSKDRTFSEQISSAYKWMESENKFYELIKGENRNFLDGAALTTLIMAISKRYFPEERYKGKKNDQFLLDELQLLEKHFCEYLANEVSENNNYEVNARNLLLGMLDKIGSSMFKDYKILSFNYTKPKFLSPIGSPSPTTPIGQIQNVHGDLESNSIVFGIDQKDIDSSDYAYQYTKTYRQMISDSHTSKNISILPFQNIISSIKFFGHSLSKLDYSYFQSIFDYYEIYSSSVTLIFYFKPYPEKTAKQFRVELTELVTEMLKEYGNTLANKDHGKNLIHKLLLEQRLIITEAKEYLD